MKVKLQVKNSIKEKEKPEAPSKPREICGPTLISLLAAIPLVLRRRRRI
ncbi:hypothetical protein BMS3Bbin15_01881 [archaeon BMS3Bbin15]|nr:hypothetical protein BMS3Bbin15_01881 [archaeon BMS3Bbin15]